MQNSEPISVEENIRITRALSNELAGFLHGLPDDVWRNPDIYASACDGWNMADVVTHLISVANMMTMSIERAIENSVAPPMGYQPQTPQERAQSIRSLRDAFYEDIFPEFNASCLRLNSLLTSLTPEQYELPAWHPATVMDVSRLIGLRLMELAIHGWDIRYGVDRDASINPIALPFLKEWIPNWLVAGFRMPDCVRGTRGTMAFRFVLSDADEETHIVRVWEKMDTFAFDPDREPEHSEVTFSLDTSSYILLLMGRMPIRRSIRRGRLILDGDIETAESLHRIFVGI